MCINKNTKIETNVKLIAFHLPQFHTFPENDEWWGKGFTEWTNTRKAKKIYKNHNQPREPLNDNYYDLSKLENLIWQMDLAKEYGVYGFCYYHYWFNGKKLLHKPLEIIREYSGSKINYCLCWANEPWTRAWEGNTNEILMAQEYGKEVEWEKHFEYLLTFFCDKSYIKIQNKPVFVLYRSNNIPYCDDMIAYWNECCIKNGFGGIYIIEEMNSFQEKAVCKNSDAVLEFEPLYTMTYGKNLLEKARDKAISIIFNHINNSKNQIYTYDWLWENILKRNHNDLKTRYLGGFVDWDNTARKGNNSRIVMKVTPEKFGKYMNQQKTIALNLDSEFIFLNAWNEWGEGTYLEPDKTHKTEYLKIIQRLFCE